jgi:hypothetical protein
LLSNSWVVLSHFSASGIVMALLVALVAGLLVLVESQAHDEVGRSSPQEFLSKFITPNLKHMQHGNGPDALSAADDTQYVTAAREESVMNTKDEERAVQKLLASGTNSTHITLSAIGIGFLALAAMLGARLRRRQAISSGGLGSDLSMNMEPVLRDNLMEMNPQGLQMNSAAALETKHPGEETSRRVGWSQLSSQNSEPLTVCYMKQKKDNLRKAADRSSIKIAPRRTGGCCGGVGRAVCRGACN